MPVWERTSFRIFVISANTENQLIHYHSNHYFSKVQMKPEYSCFYIDNIGLLLCAFSLQQMFEMMPFHTDVCPKSLCFRLNTSFSTASMLVAVRTVLGLPLPDLLVIDPVCFNCVTKSFNVFFFHPLAGYSFISLIALEPLAKYNFLTKILSSTLKNIVFCLFCIGVGICFVVMATTAAGTPLCY